MIWSLALNVFRPTVVAFQALASELRLGCVAVHVKLPLFAHHGSIKQLFLERCRNAKLEVELLNSLKSHYFKSNEVFAGSVMFPTDFGSSLPRMIHEGVAQISP